MKAFNKYSFQIAVVSFAGAIAFAISGLLVPAAIASVVGGAATLITH